ncbi:MAG: DUF5615 family PIN-like protein [Candidatus Dormibacteria bacterium]
MKLLLDEHFSLILAVRLRDRGHDVIAVTETAELRQVPDDELLRWAFRNERALLTENVRHFLPLHGQFMVSGEPRGTGAHITTAISPDAGRPGASGKSAGPLSRVPSES